MAKNKGNQNLRKEVKKRVRKLDSTIIKGTDAVFTLSVAAGERWTKLVKKTITLSQPLREKQIDMFFDTTEAVKDQVEKGVSRLQNTVGMAEPMGKMLLKEISKKDITKKLNANVNKLVSVALPGKLKKKVEKGLVKLKMEVEEAPTTAKKKVKKVVKKAAAPKKKVKATAKRTTKKAKATVKRATKKVTSSAKKDNLRLINGVGPKMERTLNSRGIKTFADMKKTSIKDLQEIIDGAGRAFAKYSAKEWKAEAVKAAKA